MDDLTRRRLLGGTAGLVAGTAGCVGGDANTDADATPTDRELMTSGSSDVDFDHPSATGINDQPTLGDRSRQGVIVAFEDPSCPSCRRFNQNTFPQIESELLAPGDVAYVFRGYPVVYEWGGPATRALEATFARDPAAVWDLKAHYFDQQGQFSTDNVLDRTRSYLDDATDVDGSAVVTEASEDTTAEAVQADYDAGRAAGASGTPTFYLFRDGEYQTTVSGAQDFTVFENVLLG